MHLQKEDKIGGIVAANFSTAKVFDSFGIDFCCGGKKSIADACKEKGISPELVIGELAKVNELKQPEVHYEKWGADFLIDYIVNNHHTYILNSIPAIELHMEKAVNAHGEKYPELQKIQALFDTLKTELLNHMAKEEKMLFPYIKKMNIALANSFKMHASPFGGIENPVKVMESEHQQAGELMQEINKFTGNFTPPPDACSTLRVLYSELAEFEKDLHTHVHIENNILFPKATEIEEKLNQSYNVL
jgi:regulator of cell morphogenesis and NO signaling